MSCDIGTESPFFKSLYANALSYYVRVNKLDDQGIKDAYYFSKDRKVDITIKYIQVRFVRRIDDL